MTVLTSPPQVLNVDQRGKFDIPTEDALLDPESRLFQPPCHLLMSGHIEDSVKFLERELFRLWEEKKD